MSKKKMAKLNQAPQSSTKVFKCYCESEFQDDKYGKGKRLCNLTARDGIARCTVCGKDVAY
jgi:hypothetical protein